MNLTKKIVNLCPVYEEEEEKIQIPDLRKKNENNLGQFMLPPRGL